MTEKPDIEEIRFKNKATGEIYSVWIISFRQPFWWTPFNEHFKCHICNKKMAKYFLFIKDFINDFGIVCCPDCLEECLVKVENPETKPVKVLFFED